MSEDREKFTHEDVDIVHYAANEIRRANPGFHVSEELASKLEDLGERIDAWLSKVVEDETP